MIGAHSPDFYFIAGAPGSGKSTRMHELLAAGGDPRRLIFDPIGQYARYGAGTFTSLEGVRRSLLAAGPGPFSIVFRPNDDDQEHECNQFSTFCRLAYAVRPVIVYVDELADVTSPNPYLVPEGWSRLLRKGRNEGVRIVAASQRPQDVDKRIRTFATRVRVGRLADADDVTLLAKMLRVPADEVNALQEVRPGVSQWIEANRLTGQVSRGVIGWRRGRPFSELRAMKDQTSSADRARPADSPSRKPPSPLRTARK